MTSPASRKSAERQRRKDAGEVRFECWMTPADIRRLDAIASGYAIPRDLAVKYALVDLHQRLKPSL